MNFHVLNGLFGVLILLMSSAVVSASDQYSDKALSKADYLAGQKAFQARCSACHTLADDSANLTGPNLWKVIGRPAGSISEFSYSTVLKEADFKWTKEKVISFISDPQGLLPGTIMNIPEPVPENLRKDLLSFLMVEIGSATWPKPEVTLSKVEFDNEKPYAERFPSFWNHMMNNTTRYRLESEGKELVVKLYFHEDGSVTSDTRAKGFWHITEKNFFCYGIHKLKFKPSQFIECVPIAAMATPRFAEELWKSRPTKGLIVHGGILPGRP